MRPLLKVLSYNIHKGFSLGNRRLVLSHIRKAIQSSGADLVFLQEVVGRHTKHKTRYQDWPTSSQFEYLADEVWPHYSYGKNAIYDEGHHGNAILSKFPLIVSENIDVSVSRLAKRGLLHAAVEVPDLGQRPLHCLCLHLDLLASQRTTQAMQIVRRIEAHVPSDCPLVLAGDFNDWEQQLSDFLADKLGLKEAFRETHGKHARTFPATMPTLRLDRIYYRGLEARTAKRPAHKTWKTLSDHLPLYAEFDASPRAKTKPV